MKFTYSSGQRVLDGYTLKRGIGRGGFGEVYYAVSDGGKEVALKLVHGQNLDIELRGMAQCLNLKHPNLLTLYDLRTDSEGDHWVVMEYIAGEALSAVLNRHPNGLPPELARQWFIALGGAINYLHDHGLVHRDLKPGNIFLENGLVKVGDYGLCKFISSSQRSAQTQSVGTVHYMAPEISTGNYNKQIDIYAGGIVLYEMLTGHVPFEGESAGEILMKHLTSPPDLSRLPGEYVPVVAKALAKNPAHRYASMAEMTKVVEAVGAAPVVKEVIRVAEPRPVPPIPKRPPTPPEPVLAALPAVSARGQVAELCGALALSAGLAALFAALFAALWERMGNAPDLPEIGASFFLTVAVSWAVLIPAKFWTNHRKGNSWGRRGVMMLIGVVIGLGACWLDGWAPQTPAEISDVSPIRVSMPAAGVPGGQPMTAFTWTPEFLPPVRTSWGEAASYLSYFALAFFAIRWWKMADRRRWQRFSFAPVLAAGFWGLVLLPIWPQPLRGTVVLMTASAIVQLVSPWEPPPPPTAKRMRLRYA